MAHALILNVRGLDCPCYKKQVRRADRSLVTVRHVNKVVIPVLHVDNVPHMRTFSSAAAHHAAHCNATDVTAKGGFVAQVFECLRVAFADHVGVRIPVKDPDHLPGIAITDAAARCLVVVSYKAADLILVAGEFLKV